MLDDELKIKLLIEHRPWENEPNFEQWVDKGTGYLCRVERNELTLSLCGYVAVPIGHKVRGMRYQEAEEFGVCAYGGLTFGGRMDDNKWFGFDCAHAGDLVPIMYMRQVTSGFNFLTRGEYRTFDWVKKETVKLAESLMAVHNMIVDKELMSAAKEALRKGKNVTETLANRGYVYREKKRS